MGALRCVEMLDHVPEHRARHAGIVRAQEAQEPLTVLRTSLTQPTTRGLVDKVVVVGEQQLGDSKSIIDLASTLARIWALQNSPE